jgi:metal-dependent amidase/aminoacylase/carboxypeptidase family protein
MTSSRLVPLFVPLVLSMSLAAATSSRAATPEQVEAIRAKAAAIQPRLVEIRRKIHQQPELSGEEVATAALVAEHLRALGLEVQTGVGGHGVVGVLRGGKPGPVVGYRADMDAVRSPVVGDPPYRSQVAGVKHVCGHDAHVAIGLGVAEVLASLRSELPGTVKFLFQPAEENVQGARAMIADGVLEQPTPAAMFALHTAPFPVGTIGVGPGVGLTGWDPFTVKVSGEGAAALAGEIAEAARALSTVPPLEDPAKVGEVLASVTSPEGPLQDFVLVMTRTTPAGVEGMVRAAGPAVYERTREQLRATVDRVAKGRAAVLEIGEHFPDMHSDPELTRAAVAPIESVLGPGTTIPLAASIPYFGEDLALFRAHMPTVLFFLGVANAERGIAAMNHTPDYDLDEEGLRIGASAMSAVLLDYLERHGKGD